MADLLTLSSLISVARVAIVPDGNFFLTVESPTLFIPETGSLRFVSPEGPGDPTFLVQPTPQGEAVSAVLVTPASTLHLKAGMLVAVPPAPTGLPLPPSVAFFNEEATPATYVHVQIFPGGSPQARLMKGLGNGVVEHLDLPLGVPTALPAAPPLFVVGRLTLEPGATAALPHGLMLLVVEKGTLTLVPKSSSAYVGQAGVEFDQLPLSITAGSEKDLVPGDGVFMPIADQSEIRNAGNGVLVLLVVEFTPSTITTTALGEPVTVAGTPSP